MPEQLETSRPHMIVSSQAHTIMSSLGFLLALYVPDLELKTPGTQNCPGTYTASTNKSLLSQPKDQEEGSLASRKLLNHTHCTPAKHQQQKLSGEPKPPSLQDYNKALQCATPTIGIMSKRLSRQPGCLSLPAGNKLPLVVGSQKSHCCPAGTKTHPYPQVSIGAKSRLLTLPDIYKAGIPTFPARELSEKAN